MSRSPDCTIFNAHNKVIGIVISITFPSCTTIHIQISCITSIAFPISPITHPQIQATIITRGHAKASTSTIIAMPIRSSGVQATDGGEVSNNLSCVIAGTSCLSINSISIFGNINIYDAIVLAGKFAIGTNSQSTTATKIRFTSTITSSNNFTATNINGRCYCRNRFASTFTTGNISTDIN